MKRLLLASAAFAFCASAHAYAQTHTFNSTSPADWTLGYSWAPQGNLGAQLTSWWAGPGQALPAAANTVSEGGGTMALGIIPRPADVPAASVGGAAFIGTLLTTHGRFSQLYGYFQVQAVMPDGPGMMGAVWLLPENGAWPPEIDIVETLANQPTTLFTTAHTSIQGAQEQGVRTVPNLTQGFHTYAVDWEADTITWYFDGAQVYQIPTPADMHVPMYVLLDTGTGTPGSWEGAPTSSTESGAMWVSSVEVWTSNPHLPPPALPSATGTVSGTVPPASTSVPVQLAAATTPATTDPASAAPASTPALASPAASVPVPDMTSVNAAAIAAATQQAQGDIAAAQASAAQAFASGQAQAQIQQLEQASAPIAAQIQALQAWIASGQAPTSDVLAVQPTILQPQQTQQ
jgi:beta-glucanase (GH16 family)